MVSYGYKKAKSIPLTLKEIEDKLKETEEEMQEVFKWKKENDVRKAKDKRGIYWKNREAGQVKRRIDSVNGTLIYWKLRKEGKSHFYANLERNEYWAKMSGKNSEEEEEED